MRLYNKHKHRRRWATLEAAKHQHPKPAQSRAHPSTASCRCIWAAKRQKPRAVLCCTPAMQPVMGLPGSRGSTSSFPVLWHTGLVLALLTAQIMHNTVIHPWIIESWLQCSAESLGETTDWLGQSRSNEQQDYSLVLFRSNCDARHKLEMQTREVFCIWRQSYIPFTNKTFFKKKISI